MKYTIASGIADSDPDGDAGRGSIFWLEIRETGDIVVERRLYGLLDVIEGKIDLDSIKRPYLEANKKLVEELAEKEAAAKKAEMEKRVESVKIDPALEAIMDAAIAANAKAITEYKAGKEKALNSVVGAVIKEAKAKKISVADGAFGITTTLKKKLA